MMKQFELWIVDLAPVKGSEQDGIRPCIILETNAVQSRGKTTIIAPLTTKIDTIFSFDSIITPTIGNGLNQKSKIKFRQIRVIDKSRLINKIGILENDYYSEIKNRLSLLFDINGDY